MDGNPGQPCSNLKSEWSSESETNSTLKNLWYSKKKRDGGDGAFPYIDTWKKHLHPGLIKRMNEASDQSKNWNKFDDDKTNHGFLE